MERFLKPLNRLDYVLHWVAFVVLFSLVLMLFFRTEMDVLMAKEGVVINFFSFSIMLVGWVVGVNFDYRRALDIYGHRFHKQDIFSAVVFLLAIFFFARLFINSLIIELIYLPYALFLLLKKGKH